jgi:hypothetical protein
MADTSETIEPTAAKPPLVRLAKGQEVSLGCGTLILITLIVLLFGGGGHGVGDLEREVRGLRYEVSELRKSVEAQTRQIQALQEKVDRAGGK